MSVKSESFSLNRTWIIKKKRFKGDLIAMEQKTSSVKRFLLFNVKHLSFIAKTFLISLLTFTIFAYKDSLEKCLQKIGIDTSNNLQVELFVGVVLGFLILGLFDQFKVSSLQKRISK